jgi:hypothetical protein
MALSDELERAKVAERVRNWDAGEARLALEAGLSRQPQQSLDADAAERWSRFSAFCTEKSVRELPAKPFVAAAFLKDQVARGVDVQGALSLLSAIEAAHDLVGLSNPTKTAAVRAILNEIVKTPAPRSWPAADKVLFAELPPDVRAIIAHREQERETALRRAQNALAEEKKKTALADGADKSASDKTSEKEVNNHVNSQA